MTFAEAMYKSNNLKLDYIYALALGNSTEIVKTRSAYLNFNPFLYMNK